MARSPVSRHPGKVPMPGSVVGAIVFLGLLAASSLFKATGELPRRRRR